MFNKHILNSMTRALVLVIGALLVVLSSQMALAQPISDGFEMRANNAAPTTRELADSMIYLPLVVKNFPLVPDAPVLSAISNEDGDGNYTVSWSSSEGADTYTLEEDDNADFSNPTTVYSGSGTSTTISGRDVGTYYYHVKASNAYASSGWSNVESVEVTVSPPDCPQTGTWMGVTSQGRPIIFGVENSPECQIAPDSLKVTYENNCDTAIRTVTFMGSISITDDHFDFDNIDHQVVGDFSSSSMASGTFDVELSASCYASGTWSATVKGANDAVDVLALQSDGKILVGGRFTTLGGQPRDSIGRLNPDGSLDTSFNPGANASVRVLAVQADGKILVGGSFTELGGQPRDRIGRLNPDGTLDTTFNPGAGGTLWAMAVEALAVQPDGKILVGGQFDLLGGESRDRIGRLNADGTVDAAFNPGVSGRVYTLAVQADGKILVGGQFTTLGGQPRDRIGRLNSDGTLDATFNPGASFPGSCFVSVLVVQPNGKIVVGGMFNMLGGQSREYIGRLNSDGSLDTSFNPGAGNTVRALAVQADGKILVGGSFTELGGETRNYIGRLNSDGIIDDTFNPGADGSVGTLVVQPDGKILTGGGFTEMGGEMRMYIARLNSDGTLDAPLP